MRDALVDLKRPSKWRNKSLARAAFSSVFVICIFLQNKSAKTQSNFILLRETHYSSKPESMSEIDFKVCHLLFDFYGHPLLRGIAFHPLALLTLSILSSLSTALMHISWKSKGSLTASQDRVVSRIARRGSHANP